MRPCLPFFFVCRLRARGATTECRSTRRARAARSARRIPTPSSTGFFTSSNLRQTLTLAPMLRDLSPVACLSNVEPESLEGAATRSPRAQPGRDTSRALVARNVSHANQRSSENSGRRSFHGYGCKDAGTRVPGKVSPRRSVSFSCVRARAARVKTVSEFGCERALAPVLIC
jgi:hypothetical protein